MEISNETVAEALLAFFRSIPDCGIASKPDVFTRCRIVDNVYQPVKQQEVLEIIRTNPSMVLHAGASGSSELTDCDDYALQLKATLTGLYRNKLLAGEDVVFPPAIGIVLTQNHALNLIICESAVSDHGVEVLLIDPSEAQPRFSSDPTSSQSALQTLPVSLIYI